MAKTLHACDYTRALFRVFIQPALSAPSNRTQPLVRAARTIPRQQRSRPFSASTVSAAPPREPTVRGQKFDEEIKHKILHLVDRETQKLSDPVTRFDVLRSYDHKTHRLVQLTPDEPRNPAFIPVCKIVDKKEEYAAEKRRKEAKREQGKATNKESSMKTLELNWAIDKNDLGHRLNRLVEFLAEGRRVDVVFAAKKRGRKASVEECEGLLKSIRERVGELPGAKELKQLDGQLGGFAQMQFEGKLVKQASPKADGGS